MIEKKIMQTTEPISVFLVDDDKAFFTSLKHHLQQKFKTSIALMGFTSGEDCLKYSYLRPDIVVLDYYLNNENPVAMTGIEVLQKLKSESKDMIVIMLSAQDTMEVAVTCVKNGAYEYVNPIYAI